MTHFNRILITGAAGRLGTQLRKGLASLAQNIRITDRVQMENIQSHEEAIICELGDYEAILALTRNVDAIIHFGGAALEQGFETILDSNIRGSYNIY